MLKIAVCDDEVKDCRKIFELIKSQRSDYQITAFLSGKDLLASQKSFDIVFLDIEMPDINGMSAAREIRNRKQNSHIIFLTNHMEVMQEAFTVRAYRFFEKPLNPEVLNNTLSEMEKEIYEFKEISFSRRGRHCAIRLNEIVYIEAFGDGTYIYTESHVYESGYQLIEWLELLKGLPFCRIFKSYIIALPYISAYFNKDVLLSTGKRLPVSRTYLKRLKKDYLEFIDKNSICM